MKKVKELLKEQEDKSVFLLTWSIMWRWFVLIAGFYAILIILALIVGMGMTIFGM